MKPFLIAAAATLALAGCGSSNNSTTAAGDTAPASSAAAQQAQQAQQGQPSAGLSTSASSLGTIVVDTAGRAVYMYDADKQGASSSVCAGGCASAWPAVPAGQVAAGVTGKVGSITGVDGKPQATLDGWPLYYYVKDSAPGDVTGQGVGGIWWVLSPSGTKIGGTAGGTAASPTAGATAGDASPDASDGSGGGGHGY